MCAQRLGLRQWANIILINPPGTGLMRTLSSLLTDAREGERNREGEREMEGGRKMEGEMHTHTMKQCLLEPLQSLPIQKPPTSNQMDKFAN